MKIKKTFRKISFLSLILSLVFSLSSCSFLFSNNDNKNSQEGKATFTGVININSVIGSEFVETKSARTARPEPVTIGTDSYEYKYYVEARCEGQPTITSEDGSNLIILDQNSATFEASLVYGDWEISVSIRKNGSIADILKDTATIPLNASTPAFRHDFFLKPVSEGTGSIELTLNISTPVAFMDVKVLDKPEGSSISDDENLMLSGSYFLYTKPSLKPGTYKLLFTFKESDGTPVFTTMQAINVVRDLTTNKWVGGEGISELINDTGTFFLTDGLIEAWQLRRTEYYVDGTENGDKNTGGPLDPFETVTHAIALINDIAYDNDTTVKIHMAKGYTEELSSPLILMDDKKALIDVWDKAGQTAAPTILRSEDSTGVKLDGEMIRIQNDAELTLDGIIIDGGGELFEDSGNCGILNAGTFTLKSGNITGNYNSSGDGAGIYNTGTGTLNLLGGSITGNKMTTSGDLGAGVYTNSLSTINLSGAVTIKNNKNSNNENSNLYLSSGSKITITGPLEEGTNKTEIYISTENSVTKEHPVTFTNNYGFYGDGYNAGKFPGRYFIGENATVTYKHATDVSDPLDEDGEAQLAVSSGQIIDPLSDIDVTFSLSKNKFMEGSDASEALRTIKIIPKYIINDTPLSGTALETALTETNWKINMYVGDKPITGCSWTDPTIVIPATVTYHDTYTLVVRASYKGITFDSEFILNEPSSYVQTAPYSWRGTTAELATLTRASTVFIANRSLDIPALLVCDHETTQEEYEKYCLYNSSKPYDGLGKGANYPAYYISWYDAIVYCNLRSMADGLTPAYKIGSETDPKVWEGIVAGTGTEAGKYCGPSSNKDSWNAIVFDQDADGWRLPTEAEWEFLARGGNTDNYRYSGSNNINEVAWYNGNSGVNGGDTNKTTHEVKGKKPNRLCLYDMNGNVWEWCWDWVGTITSSTASTGVSSGEKRRLGGGSWYSPDGRDINSHGDESPYIGNDGIGFRVVRTVTE